jgi:L-fucose isomerase-like protein
MHTDKYYPSGGVHVQYVAKDGEVTLARLAEDKDGEWLAVIPGRFRYHDRARCAETTSLWPHAYLETAAAPEDVLGLL